MVSEIYEVSRAPIGKFIFMFIAYIVLHIGIGCYLNMLKKELEKRSNTELKKQIKVVEFIFKVFPVFFVMFVITVLLLS